MDYSLISAEEVQEEFYDMGMVHTILNYIFEFYFSDYEHDSSDNDTDILEEFHIYLNDRIPDMYDNDDILCDIYDNIFLIMEFLDMKNIQYYEVPLSVNQINSTTKIIDGIVWLLFKDFLCSYQHFRIV
jgi:hypothetical protein